MVVDAGSKEEKKKKSLGPAINLGNNSLGFRTVFLLNIGPERV